MFKRCILEHSLVNDRKTTVKHCCSAGDGRKLVREIEEPVDFVFIDCNFANYGPCFAGIKDKLATGAVVAADAASFY